jgi:hypothetical protein
MVTTESGCVRGLDVNHKEVFAIRRGKMKGNKPGC